MIILFFACTLTLGVNLNHCQSFAEENGIKIIENDDDDDDKEQKSEDRDKKKIPWTTALLLFVLACGIIDVLFLNKSTNISNLRKRKKE